MKSRKGFTIIEVTLFLAVSGLLFAGIVVSTRSNIAKERFNTAAQDFAEFLRNLYSEVENVQNGRSGKEIARSQCTVSSSAAASPKTDDTAGRTDCAIYGRIAIFDPGTISAANTDRIEVYDVIGDIVKPGESLESTDLEGALIEVGAEYLATAGTSTTDPVYAGNVSYYTPDWSSHIESINKGEYFSGALLIVRSPIDGSIHTLVLGPQSPSSYRIDPRSYTIAEPLVSTDPRAIKFKKKTVNFCLNSDDAYAYNGRRRNIRVKKDGHNASAVELIDMDSGDNKCV